MDEFDVRFKETVKFYLNIISRNAIKLNHHDMVETIDEINNQESDTFLLNKNIGLRFDSETELGEVFNRLEKYKFIRERLDNFSLDHFITGEGFFIFLLFIHRLAYGYECMLNLITKSNKKYSKESCEALSIIGDLNKLWDDLYNLEGLSCSSASYRNLLLSLSNTALKIIQNTQSLYRIVKPDKTFTAQNKNKNNTPENRKFCYDYLENLKQEYKQRGEKKGWQKQAIPDLAKRFKAKESAIYSWINQYKLKNNISSKKTS